eukprot:7384401-Prymnesium_polylepis.4
MAGRPKRSVNMPSHLAKSDLAAVRSGSKKETSEAAIQQIPTRLTSVRNACSFSCTSGVASRRLKSESDVFLAPASGRTTSKTALSASARRLSSGSCAEPHSTSDTP